MATGHDRVDAKTPPPPAPPAPPVPPQKYGHRAATAIARLAQPFLYASRPSSAQGHREVKDRRPTVPRPNVRRSPRYVHFWQYGTFLEVRTDADSPCSPSSSRTAIHKTGIPILALDISPYRTHAVLAGREILKTLRVDDAKCIEELNLRSKIVAYASTHNSSKDAFSAQHRDQLSAYDVKWSHSKFDTTIATAAANGRIVLYDLNSPSVEIGRLHEHTRQVHRVAFNPHQGALLLSGSQDATIRMWDLRALGDPRSVRTCGSINTFPGYNEGIRDLKWSPSDGVEFAVGTDNGTVQRWDFRKEGAPLLKLNAHEKNCHAIDWHPSGNFLASGGADRLVKVWNFESSDRRMKPIALLRTPQIVKNLRWRPSAVYPDGSSPNSARSSSLATTYDTKDPRIHIWDFGRPDVPSQELDRYDTPASDILWHSEDRLWSVGFAGAFTQTDIKFASKPTERCSTNHLATAPDGSICSFFDEKPRRNLHTDILENQPLPLRISGGIEDKYSSSQSANEGSLEEPNILNSSIKKRRQKPAQSQPGSDVPAANLEGLSEGQKESQHLLSASYCSEQSAHIGHILGLFDADTFRHLAENYKLPSSQAAQQEDAFLHRTVADTFEYNAVIAEDVGMYRLAQSWRIVGYVAHQELLRRAREAKQARLSSPQGQKKVHILDAVDQVNEREQFQQLPGEVPSKHQPIESCSNLSTPVVRPTSDLPFLPSESVHQLDSNESQRNHDQLPRRFSPTSQVPVVQSTPSGSASSLSNVNGALMHESQTTSEGYSSGQEASLSISFDEMPDMEAEMQARRMAINDYRAKPRTVLNLDSTFDNSRMLSVAPRIDRHDSDESLQMFSASTDSDNRSSIMAGSLEDRQVLPRRKGARFSFSDESSMAASQSFKNGTKHVRTTGNGKPDPFRRESLPENQSPPSTVYKQSVNQSSVTRPKSPLPPMVHVHDNAREGCSVASVASEFIASDFLPSEPLQKDIPPWHIASLVPPLIEFHLEKLSDAQMPSFLALHLGLHFPDLFPTLQTLSYLTSYHQQLFSLQLYVSSSQFRNACESNFPGIANNVQGPGIADWYCRNCCKPVKGDGQGLCSRCEQYWGQCPICEDVPLGSFLKTQKTNTLAAKFKKDKHRKFWSWCQGCGHGGHPRCLASWFADTKACEGTCPVVGCGHDCVDGPQRDATINQIERQKGKGRKSVVRDEWSVGESRAVGRARQMVNYEPLTRKRGGSGVLGGWIESEGMHSHAEVGSTEQTLNPDTDMASPAERADDSPTV